MNVIFEKFIPNNLKHQQIFAELTREWLIEYNFLEPVDEIILANPENHILAHDGQIIFAIAEGNYIGTGVLFRCDANLYEIGKMAVTRSMRGKGIGRLIAEELINIARQKNIRTLYLGSNSNLHVALALYRSLGFVETPMNHSAHYESCDINMKLDL